MLIDRRYLFNFDWLSFGLTWTITFIGLAFIYSSTTTEIVPYSVFFKKQCFGLCTGFFIYLFFSLKDYRKLCRWGYFAYFLVFCLLIFTLIKGKVGMGARRWIDLKIFKFQPSEIIKLIFPPFLTYYLYTENDVPLYTMNTFAPILGVLAISSLLILKQPDLGTAIIFLGSGLVMLWFSGIGNKFFGYGLLLFLLTAPITWKALKPYQQKRVLVFLGAGDNRKERYQIEQSKIAIGSGQITGKGFEKGTQNKLMFLPESRTDFIFAVICEEWGFLGALFLLLLYFLLFVRIMIKLKNIPTFFAQLLGIGILSSIVLATFINLAMVCNMLPVVGIPLPLVSYGITSLWITLASLGWIQGITTRTF